MHPFTFERAQTPQQALELGMGANAHFLAGGSTKIDLMKLHVENPDALIDINELPLSQIAELPGGGLRIGAMARNSDCAHSPLVKQRFPVLSEALLSGASAQLRNMATTGGNLLQRTRCYYFRDTAQPCNKREPGTGCPAIDGVNRIHAVLGGSPHCIAAHPSDMCVALAALDAVIVTQGRRRERRIPINQFYLLPGDHPERENVLEHGELITAVEIPSTPFAVRSHYIKVRDRASYSFALASAAVALDIRDGAIREARVALGGVGTRPWRAREAEAALVGKPAGRTAFREAADAALAGAVGRRDNAFKIELARRTLVRTLTATSQMQA